MKVAVVGIRGMGQTHIQGLRKCKVVQDVVGCDISPEVRRDVEKKLGVKTFGDVPTLLADYCPNAVIVVTPPSRHGEVIRACFERGVAVLTEKPICSTLAESEELVTLAEQRKIPFQCGFELRYCGSIRAVKSVLDSGQLGRLSHIGLTQISGSHATPGYMARKRTGGIFYEKLCHQVDLFRYLLGEPQRVMAIAAPILLKHYEIEDNIMSVMEFKDGALGTIKFDTRRAAQVDGLARPERKFEGREAGHYYELVFSGDRGTAVYDAWTERVEVLRVNHRPDLLTERVRQIRVREEFGEPSYDVTSQDGDFLQRVSSGQPLQFPARDALESMRWVERAEESLRQHGAWIAGS